MRNEEKFCEIILNLGQWFWRRCRLKIFLSGARAAVQFGGAETFVQFIKEGIMGNIHGKLYETSGSGGDVV